MGFIPRTALLTVVYFSCIVLDAQTPSVCLSCPVDYFKKVWTTVV